MIYFVLCLLVLKKAHQNMIDSHVAAYTALLLGLLAEHNQVGSTHGIYSLCSPLVPQWYLIVSV